MNKKLLTIFLFISYSAFAVNPDAVIILLDKNHQGKIIDKEVVIVANGTMMVNREKLSPSEVITQSPHITEIANFKSNESGQCHAGTFKHILKKGKIVKVEEGCLNSDRYKTLKASFKALHKDTITQ